MNILAIETSCDETAIALAEFSGTKQHAHMRVHSHIVSSQIALHKAFGGVVPNLARREHEKNLIPILLQAFKEATLFAAKKKISVPQLNTKKKLEHIFQKEPDLLKQFEKNIIPLAPPPIDAIAVTHGPGLAPALWVGVNFARALALLWDKPLMPINHMAGHLYSALLGEEKIKQVAFPALALLVSGGHTELVLMKKHGAYQILGQTLDDAVGEAFDKVARMLDLGYPGGPALSALAQRANTDTHSTKRITLPRPMLHAKNYDFSFSGLKTAVLYLVRDLQKTVPKQTFTKHMRPLIAKEFQNAAVEVLIKKTISAAKEHAAKTILLGGGVAANTHLRNELAHAIEKELARTHLYIPPQDLTGDNALMIAAAAFFMGKKKNPARVGAEPHITL